MDFEDVIFEHNGYTYTAENVFYSEYSERDTDYTEDHFEVNGDICIVYDDDEDTEVLSEDERAELLDNKSAVQAIKKSIGADC